MKRTTLIAMIFVAAYCTACGTTFSQITGNTSASSYGSGGTTTTIPTGTTTTTITSSTTTTGTNALITERVGTVGYNSTTVTVAAGTVLKMTFSPGIQDQTIAGTGVSPQYSELGVYLTVGNLTQDTGMLANGLYQAQQTSQILDFSSQLSSGASSNPAFRQSYTITISRPNNDYWCLNYGEYCPWSNVYSTHPWHGTLTIQTDDTVAITAI
jgi:hypothetical protein